MKRHTGGRLVWRSLLGGEGFSRRLAAAQVVTLFMFWIFACRTWATADGAEPVRDHAADSAGRLFVGAAAETFHCDASMALAGMLEPRFTDQQEGELRATAVVIEWKPTASLSREPITQPVAPLESQRIAIVSCDVLFLPREVVDAALQEIEQLVAIPASHVLVHATHTHHAPSLTAVHGYKADPRFREEVRRAIVAAVQQATSDIGTDPVTLFFGAGRETTVGGNSRMRLPNGIITWINPRRESGVIGRPTGPFDPELPILDFRGADGQSRAIIFNHSTHTIGTIGGEVRSPSFYGLAAQALEAELGATTAFLEGASGSTHNIDQVPVDEAVRRMQHAVRAARHNATPARVPFIAANKRRFRYRVRRFDEASEEQAVARYTTQYLGTGSDRVREIFRLMRNELTPLQGQSRETWLQVICLGDTAIVGVPAEYFTYLGMDIKRRSPFPHTIVAELANDWIGYLPDREAHFLGGYQTWMGLHSLAEPGTGEQVANEVVAMLNQVAARYGSELALNVNATHVSSRQSVSNASIIPLDRPRSPDEERASFHFADATIQAELVAAEPNVQSPVALAWDANGRMYVAEMIGYPAELRQSRVTRWQDSDRDGTWEQSQIFADQLNFPTSILPWRNGIVVADAPDLLYLVDKDGDGRADQREVLLTGFHEGSQQLRANSLHLGLDGWIYGANGRCDGALRLPNQTPEQAISIRGRDFRFNPVDGRIEALVGQSQFGQIHDDFGQRFLSWNTIPIRHAAVSDKYVTQLPRYVNRAIIDLTPAEDNGEIFSRSPQPLQFNAESANFYNAMCGLAIQRGDGLGPDYQGNAFIGESLSNLITRRRFVPQGISFVAHRPELHGEFLAAADPWFHPVNLITGPDGCLYVTDFYRQFVEHPIYVASEVSRTTTPWRTGAEHGRIWRLQRRNFLVPPDRRNRQPQQESNETLVDTLSHPVAWWRETAQRLLVERQATSVVPLLRERLVSCPAPLGRLHTLATLSGLAVLDVNDLKVALHDPDPVLRWFALTLLEEHPAWQDTLRAEILQCAADASDRVRLEATWLTADKLDEDILTVVASQLADTDVTQVWQWRAALSGGSARIEQVLHRLPELTGTVGADREVETRIELELLAGEMAADSPSASHVEHLLDSLLNSIEAVKLSDGTHRALWVQAHLPAVLAFVAACSPGEQPEVAARVLERALQSRPNSWQSIFEAAVRHAQQNDLPVAHRRAALATLTWSKPEILRRELLYELIIRLWSEEHPTEVREQAMQLATALPDDSLVVSLYDHFSALSPAARRVLLQRSTSNPRATAALLHALSRGQVRPTELPTEVTAALRSLPNASQRSRAEELLGQASHAPRQQVVDAYQSALTLVGSASRGQALFGEHCVTCHTRQGAGRRVGPDLSSIGTRSAAALLIDVLDPSRHVAPDFVAYTAVTAGGQVTTGIVASETADSLTLRSADGRDVTLPFRAIEQLTALQTSLMPDGFEAKLNPQAAADLLEFLTHPIAH